MEETSETLEKLNITDSSLNAVSSDFDVEEAPENLEDEFSVVSFFQIFLIYFKSKRQDSLYMKENVNAHN